jgi:hypothetical protein
VSHLEPVLWPSSELAQTTIGAPRPQQVLVQADGVSKEVESLLDDVELITHHIDGEHEKGKFLGPKFEGLAALRSPDILPFLKSEVLKLLEVQGGGCGVDPSAKLTPRSPSATRKHHPTNIVRILEAIDANLNKVDGET